MRTKSLLLTTAVIAAGLGAATAQSVYSVNAVGYVNLNLAAGYTMIANPLNATNNTIAALLPSVPNFTSLYKWNDGTQSYDIYTSIFGTWSPDGDATMNPGEGLFIQLGSPTTITFVGEVLQGNLTNSVPGPFSIRSSKVPQSGLISTALGLTVNNFDTLYQWNAGTQAYDIYTSIFGSWSPQEPFVSVGESFFLQTGAPLSWTRTFSVN